MKKIIRFFKYNESMLKFYLILLKTAITATFIGLACVIPMFFMKYQIYEKTMFYQGMKYGLAPIISYVFSGFFWGPAVMWWAAKRNETPNAAKVMRLVAVLISIIPGGALYNEVIQPYTHYTYTGPWNALLFLIIGSVYSLIIWLIIKKPFDYIESVEEI